MDYIADMNEATNKLNGTGNPAEMARGMKFGLVGLNHKTAPFELREKMSFTESEVNEALLALKHSTGASRGQGIADYVSEAVLVSTCNRTEFYVRYHCGMFVPRILISFLAERKGATFEEIEPHLYKLENEKAIEHLFQVSAGLDSMVVGEHQITGQLKRSFEQAVACGTNGAFVNKLFHMAFRVAKRVRTETRIGQGSTSVSQAALDFANRTLGKLGDKRGLVIGAGETAMLAAKHMRLRGLAEVTIVNRTFHRARELASRLDVKAAVWESLADLVRDADVVVSATSSPEPVISEPMVRRAIDGRTNPLFLVDLAVPRDIAPAIREIGGVEVHDMAALQAHIEANIQSREGEAEKALEIVAAIETEFLTWHQTQKLAPAIADLRAEADAVRNAELAKLKEQLSPEQYALVEAATRTLVNKILHKPIMALKESACPRNEDVA
ncbi:MAG: glutamyl-tRNA reductase [Deltaproteobacteria bacterium]|nr:glutamyl-tRNA reductase [Deltaproteobacteria bacterium]